jgi:hypothetical protein
MRTLVQQLNEPLNKLRMGQNQSLQPPPTDAQKEQDKKDKKEKKWEPNVPTRVGRKKRKGPSAAGKLPNVYPNSRCKLRLLKMERIKGNLIILTLLLSFLLFFLSFALY